MIIINRAKQKIFKTPSLGLLPQKEDKRDIQVGKLWFGGYTPKYKSKIIPHRRIHWQKANTCGWVSSTGMKEIDENIDLSKRSLVIRGKAEGYISGDGFSNLRNNEKIVQKFGIAEASLCDDFESRDIGWVEYSNINHLNQHATDNALTHRSKSYASVTNSDELVKMIDEGRPVKIGVKWHSGWNMGEGFKAPYIMKPGIGYYVGGHAMYANGYNLDYFGEKVAIIVNSFGKTWGDNGVGYMKLKDLEEYIRLYGSYVNYDLDVDVLRWLQENQGAVVRGYSKPEIYLIQGDKKRFYVDAVTMIAHGKHPDRDVKFIEDSILNNVKRGEDIDFYQGGNIKQVEAIYDMVKGNKEWELQFKKYINKYI